MRRNEFYIDIVKVKYSSIFIDNEQLIFILLYLQFFFNLYMHHIILIKLINNIREALPLH